jgi:hypothetical protein
MAKYYIVSKSYNSIIYIESFLITFALTQGISDYFKYHWAYSIIVFFIILCLFLFAFFNFRILRYVITLFFSMTYGFFGYSLGRLIEEETFTAAVILAFICYFLSLAYHVSDFNLVKDSVDNNFED